MQHNYSKVRGEYLDYATAAQVLGVSKRKLIELTLENDDPLPVIRITPNLPRIKESDLHAWADRRRQKHQSTINALVDEVLREL